MASSSVYGSGKTIGRGQSGRVRNMGAMLDPKLLAVEQMLTNAQNGVTGYQYGTGGVQIMPDNEALDKARATLRSRGYQQDGNGGWLLHGVQAATRTAPTTQSVDDEVDELLRWLADL